MILLGFILGFALDFIFLEKKETATKEEEQATESLISVTYNQSIYKLGSIYFGKRLMFLHL